jgi:hypothetical protein
LSKDQFGLPPPILLIILIPSKIPLPSFPVFHVFLSKFSPLSPKNFLPVNDDLLEKKLRARPAPKLPATWRAEILSTALREARASASSRQVWPTPLVYLRNLFARNPFTASALTALWMLIFLFKAGTPVDPSEKMLLAHYDPSRPVYLVSLQDEIQLAELWQDQPEQSQLRQIP